MHYKVAWFILGVWLYTFIGVKLGMPYLEESEGLNRYDPLVRILIILIWPIIDILRYFGVD